MFHPKQFAFSQQFQSATTTIKACGDYRDLRLTLLRTEIGKSLDTFAKAGAANPKRVEFFEKAAKDGVTVKPHPIETRNTHQAPAYITHGHTCTAEHFAHTHNP